MTSASREVKISESVSIDLDELESLPKHEQEAMGAQILAYRKAIEDNPLLDYHPHPKQVQLHKAWTKIKAFIAGNRSGKTKGGVADDLIQCLDEEMVPEHLLPFKKWQPPFKCRIIVPDFTHSMEAVMEHLRELTPPAALRGGGFENAYDKVGRILWFQNGSMIDLMTYEQDEDKFGGVRRHRIHYDEEPPENIRNHCIRRLMDYGGDEQFTFTPEKGMSWTKDKIYDLRSEDYITVVNAGIKDNPHIPPAEVDFMLSQLPTDELRRIALTGEYAAIGGIFYPEFRDEVHVVEPPDPKRIQGQEIVCGIDPGYNTAACIWVAFDNDNAALVFDELYTHKEVSDQIAPKIRDRNAFWGVKPRYVIDPSARNMATVNADQVESSFARAGIYCEHGQNSRAAGITEVKRRLQDRQIVVSTECRGLRKEFPDYRRDPKGSDEWQAVKVNDHGLDAMRYALMARAWNLPKEATTRPRTYGDLEVGPFRPRQPDSPPLGIYS